MGEDSTHTGVMQSTQYSSENAKYSVNTQYSVLGKCKILILSTEYCVYPISEKVDDSTHFFEYFHVH